MLDPATRMLDPATRSRGRFSSKYFATRATRNTTIERAGKGYRKYGLFLKMEKQTEWVNNIVSLQKLSLD